MSITVIDIIRLLVKPVARFCMDRSLKIQDFIEASKIAFYEVALEEMAKNSTAHSGSKIAVMTGLHRRDTTRLSGGRENIKTQATLLSKVIGAWRNSKQYQTPGGSARILTVEGKDSEFFNLVASISNDLNPYTVLYELERGGLVVRVKNGIKLQSPAFIVSDNVIEGAHMLSSDSADLINAVLGNIEGQVQPKNLHIKTEFDNIPLENIPEIRKWMLKEGTEFQKKVESYLSKFDADINPKKNKAGDAPRARVAIVSYSITEQNKGK